jgi:probable F420-dependent oxidoreductase
LSSRTDSGPRAFRFAAASPGIADAHAWQELARAVEGLGYSTLLVSDHVHHDLAPLPALAAAAAATRTLRLGTYVLGLDFRNPVVLAKDLATLDVLSEGRLEVGVGIGWNGDDYRATGVPVVPAAVRAERFREAFAILKRTLAGESFSFAGTHFRVEEVGAVPAPVQRPRPPLLVGGGRRGILGFAAREADAVSLAPRSADGRLDEQDATPEAVDRKVGWIRAAAGARVAELELDHLVFECMVTPRPDEVVELYARGMGVPPERVRENPCLLIGSAGELVETLERRRARWGISHVAIPADAAGAFAPVVDRLAGR